MSTEAAMVRVKPQAFAARIEGKLNEMLAGRGLEARVREKPKDGDGLVVDVEFRMCGDLAERAIEAAAKFGRPPQELLCDVIESVVRDDLWAAVIDP